MPSLEEKLSEFQRLNTEVVGISVDSVPCHENWARSLGGITYPLLSDMHRTVSKSYGVLNDEAGIARRSVFLVDTTGKIRFKEEYGKGELPDAQKLLAAVRGIAP